MPTAAAPPRAPLPAGGLRRPRREDGERDADAASGAIADTTTGTPLCSPPRARATTLEARPTLRRSAEMAVSPSDGPAKEAASKRRLCLTIAVVAQLLVVKVGDHGLLGLHCRPSWPQTPLWCVLGVREQMARATWARSNAIGCATRGCRDACAAACRALCGAVSARRERQKGKMARERVERSIGRKTQSFWGPCF